jgi:hypothetical protein
MRSLSVVGSAPVIPPPIRSVPGRAGRAVGKLGARQGRQVRSSCFDILVRALGHRRPVPGPRARCEKHGRGGEGFRSPRNFPFQRSCSQLVVLRLWLISMFVQAVTGAHAEEPRFHVQLIGPKLQAGTSWNRDVDSLWRCGGGRRGSHEAPPGASQVLELTSVSERSQAPAWPSALQVDEPCPQGRWLTPYEAVRCRLFMQVSLCCRTL